ncbi:MAG: hypothetical protein R8P61_21465 [Bacteroidia bacterium]|nr:hypothetical protein [Bacteroidia bacterium]
MKKYVTKLGLFLGLVSFLPVMLVTLLSINSYQPILTNSLSFDTKLHHILDNDIQKVDVMVHGSSIALNNFHSETFSSYLSDELSFYNFSSWNLNMENNYLILDVFTERFEPKTVILPSCYEDFQQAVVQLCSKSDLNLFLDDYAKPFFYLKHLDLFNILRRKKNVDEFRRESVKNTQKQYFLDENGGVSLTVSKQNLNLKRWNKELIAKIDTNQYTYLEKICETMQERNIKLVYVQTPMKKDNCKTKECQDFQKAHQKLVKDIVEKYGHTYEDFYTDNPYPDSMFCDEIHLNLDGPSYFTKQLVSKLDNGEIITRVKN